MKPTLQTGALTPEELKRAFKAFKGQIHRVSKDQPDRNGHTVEVKMSFEEWLSIWQASGKLHLRGRGAGKFCMGRHNDLGDYEVGNVSIISWEQNSADAKRGRPVKQATRDKMSEQRKGVAKPLEHRAAIATAIAKVPAATCPHCGKSGQNAAMHRHHFDNCKLRGQSWLFDPTVP